MSNQTTNQTAVEALGALAHDHRLAVFRLLVQVGSDGLAAGMLAERLDLPASSLSFHLSHLYRAGLVKQQRRGRSLVYSADYSAMNALMAYLTENCCAGVECRTNVTCESHVLQERKTA